MKGVIAEGKWTWDILPGHRAKSSMTVIKQFDGVLPKEAKEQD